MIQDKDCNTVYFAEYLQVMFPKLYESLRKILIKYVRFLRMFRMIGSIEKMDIHLTILL